MSSASKKTRAVPQTSGIVRPTCGLNATLKDCVDKALSGRGLRLRNLKDKLKEKKGWEKTAFYDFLSLPLKDATPGKLAGDLKAMQLLAVMNEIAGSKAANALTWAGILPSRDDGGAPSEKETMRARLAGEDDSGVGFVASKNLRMHLAEMRRELSCAENIRDFTAIRQLLEAFATALESIRAWRRASTTLDELAQINKVLGDTASEITALLRSATALYRAEAYDEAMVRLDSIITKLDRSRLGLGRTRIKALDYLALVLLRKGFPAKALELFQGKNREARRAHETPPLIWAALANRMGLCHLELKSFTKARSLLFAAHRVRSRLRALTETSRSLHNMALLNYREAAAYDKEKYKAAHIGFTFALRAQEAVADVAGQVKTRFYLGQCSRRLYELYRSVPAAEREKTWTLKLDVFTFPNRYYRKVITALDELHGRTMPRFVNVSDLARLALHYYETALEMSRTDDESTIHREAERALADFRDSLATTK